MNELSRHIEILLLGNDCVIVPNFGGFMAHHSPAEYDEESGLFYPPQRTLGFNSQLTLNDSLLAQSYVEAYDISYPEAIQRIENEVAEIKQLIAIDGEYEFHGIGTITQDTNGIYDFEPCTAGLLTPDLYALNSFSMELLERETKAETKLDTPHTITIETKKKPSHTFTILKNVAAAALILLLFVFSSIPAGIGSNKTISCSVIDTEFITSFIMNSTFLNNEQANVRNNGANAIQGNSTSTKDTFVNVIPEKKAKTEIDGKYFIVLASKVTRSGAEEFISKLESKGLKEAKIHENGSMRKVIYGAYKTKAIADASLDKLKDKYASFQEAWVDCK